jgi:plasmid stabilization system protein ParE
MRVRVTTQARADILAAVAWWKRNRDKAPHLLEEELRAARIRLAQTPLGGVPIQDDGVPGLRRLALLQTRYFIFYRVDPTLGDVVVLRLWHASRGQAPEL